MAQIIRGRVPDDLLVNIRAAISLLTEGEDLTQEQFMDAITQLITSTMMLDEYLSGGGAPPYAWLTNRPLLDLSSAN